MNISMCEHAVRFGKTSSPHCVNHNATADSGAASGIAGYSAHLTSIDERPAGVLARRIPGHWESDLIVGKDHKSALISLVERKFRYTILIRTTLLDAETFATKVTEVLNGLPQKLRRTITHDNGKEIAKAFDIETKTGMRVYVAHPRSP